MIFLGIQLNCSKQCVLWISHYCLNFFFLFTNLSLNYSNFFTVVFWLEFTFNFYFKWDSVLKTSAALRRRHSFRFSRLELNGAQPKTNFDRLFRCYCLCLVWYVSRTYTYIWHIHAMRCACIVLLMTETTVCTVIVRTVCMETRWRMVNIVHWTGVRMYRCVRAVFTVPMCVPIPTFVCFAFSTHQQKCGWVILCDGDNYSEFRILVWLHCNCFHSFVCFIGNLHTAFEGFFKLFVMGSCATD